MTATTSLTDRYVAAVLRSVPDAKRADIEKELRASIADAIDARLEAGEDAATAERAVLNELGDPLRLAAGYTGRPLHLVGPALYVDYVRLLRVLLAIVLPFTLLGVGIAQAIIGADLGDIVADAVVTTLTVGVHLCFWTTLMFVIIERVGVAKPLTAFDLDLLPAVPDRGAVRWTEPVATAVFLALFVGALFWQRAFSVFSDAAGRPIPVVAPEMWDFWVPYVVVLAILELVFALVLLRVGRWTRPLAVVNIALNAAVVIPVGWLVWTGQALNPVFFAEFGWDEVIEPGGIAVTIFLIGLIAVAIWEALDGVIKAERARRIPIAS